MIIVNYNKETSSFNVTCLKKLYVSENFDWYNFLTDQTKIYFRRHKIINIIFDLYSLYKFYIPKKMINKVNDELENQIFNSINLLIKTHVIFLTQGELIEHYIKIGLIHEAHYY